MDIEDVVEIIDKLEKGYTCIVEPEKDLTEEWIYNRVRESLEKAERELHIYMGIEGRILKARMLEQPTMDGSSFEILVCWCPNNSVLYYDGSEPYVPIKIKSYIPPKNPNQLNIF